ncbi:hypothetical protein BGZ91_001984 [Linnemannia elongata]|nr:hypothetical protein BGZ91_001984 [Linnemannia elongata]
MVKALSFALLGLLAAVASAAPSRSTRQSLNQWLSHCPQSLSDYDSMETPAIVYLPHTKRRTSLDLDDIMQSLIDKKLAFDYDAEAYHASLVKSICNNPYSDYYIEDCKITILSEPKIKVIPTKRLTSEIDCKSSSCKIFYRETVGVWTTHSHETTLPIRVGKVPFQDGIEFQKSLGYGFGTIYGVEVPIDYQFDLTEGDKGHIAIVGAEISAKIRVTGCERSRDDIRRGSCNSECSTFLDQTGHNEVIITQNGYDPKAILAFVSA